MADQPDLFSDLGPSPVSVHAFTRAVSGLCKACGRHERAEVHEPYPLYGGTPPHVAGDTSTAAAESIRPNIGRMHAAIMALFDGRHEWTCDALEVATGFSHQSCSARVRELVQLHRLIDTGRRARTRSGRNARIYVLAPAGGVSDQNTEEES